jgi:hypothetical protein
MDGPPYFPSDPVRIQVGQVGLGIGFRVQGEGFGVEGLGLRDRDKLEGFGFGVWGLGLRVEG